MKPNIIEIVTDKGLQVYINLNFVKYVSLGIHKSAKGDKPQMNLEFEDGTSFSVHSEAYVQKLTQAIKGFLV